MIFQTLRTGAGYWNPLLMLFSLAIIGGILLFVERVVRGISLRRKNRALLSQKMISKLEPLSHNPELDFAEKTEHNPYFKLLNLLDERHFGTQLRIFCYLLFLLLCAAVWG